MKDFWKMPLAELRDCAAEETLRRHGRTVTYVVNRNANFTRVCTVGCAFCGFGKRPGTLGATSDRIDEVVARVGKTPWVTEVCLQGGIDPELRPEYYFDLVKALREAFPWMHLHAFSPMEIDSLCEKAGCGPEEMMGKLRAAGVGTIPGTAAEILVDEVRRKISRNKLPAARWVEIVQAAHRAGVRSSATILFGHVERWEDIRSHFEILRRVQGGDRWVYRICALGFRALPKSFGSAACSACWWYQGAGGADPKEGNAALPFGSDGFRRGDSEPSDQLG